MITLQAALFCGLFALCAWAIISPSVHTGVFCTLGLGCIALAALSAIECTTITPREALMAAGIGIIGTRAAWRFWRKRNPIEHGTAP